MAKIIIERDEEGLLVGHIEGDLHESSPAWEISEHLKPDGVDCGPPSYISDCFGEVSENTRVGYAEFKGLRD